MLLHILMSSALGCNGASYERLIPLGGAMGGLAVLRLSQEREDDLFRPDVWVIDAEVDILGGTSSERGTNPGEWSLGTYTVRDYATGVGALVSRAKQLIQPLPLVPFRYLRCPYEDSCSGLSRPKGETHSKVGELREFQVDEQCYRLWTLATRGMLIPPETSDVQVLRSEDVGKATKPFVPHHGDVIEMIEAMGSHCRPPS